MRTRRGKSLAWVLASAGIMLALAALFTMPTTTRESGMNFPCNDTSTSASSLAITSMIDLTGASTYVGGQSFHISVSVRNTGTTNLKYWYISLTFGGYTCMSAPAQQFTGTYGPGTTIIATIPVTISATATTQDPVTITANAEATEEWMPVQVYASPVSISKRVQARASVSITSMSITSPRAAPGPYVAGETLTLVVTFANSGGTSATVDATIDDGAYTGLSLTDNPAQVTVPASETRTQAFTIPIIASAADATVTITATWAGTEAISGRAISGSAPIQLLINIGCSPVSITGMSITTPRVPPGPYVAGEILTLVITFSNTGPTAATVDATIDDGAYTGLSFASNPAPVMVYPGSTSTQTFTIPILTSASSAAVTITATWTGTEEISGRALSGGPNYLAMNIQSRSSITITGMAITSPRAGPGPYLGGETMNLTVTYTNAGGTAGTVDATIDDGAYTGLTLTDNPAAVTVNAGGTNTQIFTIPVKLSASAGAITVSAAWTGIEALTSRAISGFSSIMFNIGGPPSIAFVDTVALNATFSYPHRWVLAMVTVRNSGGTGITNGSVTLLFNATSSITQVPQNQSMGLSIPAGGSVGVQIKFLIPSDLGGARYIRVDARFTGLEAYTGINKTDNTACTPGVVQVYITQYFYIHQSINSGRIIYVRGESFVVRVTIDNSISTTPVTGVTMSLDLGGATGFVVNVTYTGLTISAGSIAERDFLVTTSAGAAATCTLRARVTGNNPASFDMYTTTTVITTVAPAQVAITSMSITTPRAAPGPYVGGETLTLVVTYSNTGGTAATVDATIDDGAYTGLSLTDNPVQVTVPASETRTQAFTIPILTTAVDATVTITSTWAGTEAISGRAISGSAPIQLLINIGCSPVSITGMSITTPRVPPGPYVAGEILTLVITFSNTGPTAATVDATIDAGAYTGLSIASNPAPVMVYPGSTSTQTFTIPILTSASSAAVTITATWTGTEEISGRALSGGPNYLAMNIQSRSSITITGMAITSPRAGPGPYLGGETMSLTVTYTNAGGTAGTVDATIDDGAYAGLTLTDNPAAVTVNAGGTNTQVFSIPIFTGASTTAVTIAAAFNGTEAYTSRALTGSNTVNVNIQAVSNIFVDTVALNTTLTYMTRWVLAMVRVRNTGGTSVNTGSVTLSFNSSYAINPTAVNQSTGLTVVAGGSVSVQIQFQISSAVTASTSILVNARFTGLEQYSGTNRTDATACTPAVVHIFRSPPYYINHVILGGRTTYVSGETFVVRVTIYNSVGTTQITGGSLMLDFGGATGFAQNTTALPDPILQGSIITRDIMITTNAATTCFLRARLVGFNPGAIDTYSCPSIITTVARASISIAIMSITSPRAAPGPYVAGETLMLVVTYSNTGGTAATVDATIDDGAYTGLVLTANPAATTVLAGGTSCQVFNIPILAGALAAGVTIVVAWSGLEEYTGRALSGAPGAINVSVASVPENLAPLASIVVNTTRALIGDEILFTSTSSDLDGTIISWRWDFCDGTNAFRDTCVHVFSAPGTFTVTLQVSDDRGGSSSTSVVITVTMPTSSGDPMTMQDTLAMSMAGIGALFMVAGIGLAASMARKKRHRRVVPDL